MNQNQDDQLADLITARALDPDTARPDEVSPAEWEEIGDLALIERQLRSGAHTAPTLEKDRTAAMLGLVPDSHTQLDPDALKRRRKQAGLSVSQLAARLVERGWDITQRDVFQWENHSSAGVPPALIERIATVLGTDANVLTTVRTGADTLDVTQPGIQALAERLASALGVGVDMAISRMRSTAAVAVHRGDKPKDDQMMATLEAYVRAMERRHEH